MSNIRNKWLSALLTAALVLVAAFTTNRLVAQSRTITITQVDRTSIEDAIHKVAAKNGLHAVVRISDRIVEVRDSASAPAANREIRTDATPVATKQAR